MQWLVGLRRSGLGLGWCASGWPGGVRFWPRCLNPVGHLRLDLMLLGWLGVCRSWPGSGRRGPIDCCARVTAYHAATLLMGADRYFPTEAVGKSPEGTTNSERYAQQQFEFQHPNLKRSLNFLLGYIINKLPATCSMTAIAENNYVTFVSLYIVLNYCIGLMAYL